MLCNARFLGNAEGKECWKLNNPFPEAIKSGLKNTRCVLRRVFLARVLVAANRLRGRQVVHFLHIGKTGGSAIKVALRPCRCTGRFLLKLHPHRVTLRDVRRGEKIVFFVRDPVGRFVSGFYSRQRKGQPLYFREWSPEEEAAFRLFATPNDLATALSSGVRDRREAAANAMRSIPHVRTSYWYWFENEGYFLSRSSDILFIGLQESLADNFAVLKEMLKLPESVRLPQDDVAAHRNPRDLDAHLDPEAIKNLKAWYAADYDFIKLCIRWRTEAKIRSEKTIAIIPPLPVS